MREFITQLLIHKVVEKREPDFTIGGANPYMKRWYIIPRNRFFNIYLHEMWRSDDDRALHDHPWWWASWILRGSYYEHTKSHIQFFEAGSFRIRPAKFAHMLSLSLGAKPLTLFITGPKLREWGFHCPKGWRHWAEFTNPLDGGATIGRGCE